MFMNLKHIVLNNNSSFYNTVIVPVEKFVSHNFIDILQTQIQTELALDKFNCAILTSLYNYLGKSTLRCLTEELMNKMHSLQTVKSPERWWEDVRPEMKTPRRDAFPVMLRWGGAAWQSEREGKRGSRPESRVGDVPVTIRIVSNNSTLQESSWTVYSYLGQDTRGTYVIGNGTIRIISFVPIQNVHFDRSSCLRFLFFCFDSDVCYTILSLSHQKVLLAV